MGSLYPTKDGTWQIRKRKAVGSMPSNTEELRVKYALMDVHWRMMALRHDGRSFAVGLKLGTWDHHLKYLMGKKVYQLRGKDQHGKEVVAPSWTTMLTYEYEMRKYAMKKLNYTTLSLPQALEEARDNAELRLLHFLTPLALGGNTHSGSELSSSASSYLQESGASKRRKKEQPQLPQQPWTQPPYWSKGEGKKGKGQGAKGDQKGKAKGGKGDKGGKDYESRYDVVRKANPGQGHSAAFPLENTCTREQADLFQLPTADWL